jgi:hypothetical protein
MGGHRWRKLGLVFCPNGSADWMATHAAYPTPLALGADVVRVFFSPRDHENRANVGYLDLSLRGDEFSVIGVAEQPVLRPGRRGAFDDSGVTVGSVVARDGQLYLYYLGWSLGVTAPFRNFIGLAIGDPETLAFERVSEAPVLDRSPLDPFSLSYPWVATSAGRWLMWYGSIIEWGTAGTELTSDLRLAESQDGVSWAPRVQSAVPLGGPPEYALSRPTLVRETGIWRMWYSRRIPDYRIGYAESRDGERWVRKDAEAGVSVSPSGWDSESVEYPAVFDFGASRYMLYNGNAYGRTGFGLAIAEPTA